MFASFQQLGSRTSWGFGAVLLMLSTAGVNLLSGQYYQGYGGQYVVAKPAWVDSMFAETKHDFGTVARATKQVHDFEFTNTSGNEMFLSGVRASCGCAEPEILNQRVAPGEKGKIRIHFNTLRFIGDRKATITVTVSSPQYTEVQLQIVGVVRQDIVVNPGEVDFQSVTAGDPASKTIEINYAGRNDWSITEVRSPNPAVTVELNEQNRGQGLVSYSATIALAGDARPGMLNEPLTFVTNDSRMQEFPVYVKGYVKATVQVPTLFSLGSIEVGDSAGKKLVVRSDSEFEISMASCGDARIEIESPKPGVRKMHVLNVKLTGKTGGTITEPILLATSLGPASVRLSGEVVAKPSGEDIASDKEPEE